MQRNKDVTAGSFRPVCSDFYDVISCVKWAWRIADKSQGVYICCSGLGAPRFVTLPQGKNKKPTSKRLLSRLHFMTVRMTGLEPTRRKTLDPKSSAATNYATSARAVQRYKKFINSTMITVQSLAGRAIRPHFTNPLYRRWLARESYRLLSKPVRGPYLS